MHVQVGNDQYDATARVVTPDDADYVRLWKLVNSINGNRYDAYQAKTTRPIAMVVVERRLDVVTCRSRRGARFSVNTADLRGRRCW